MPAEDSQPESSLIELPILGGPQPAPLRRYDWRWLPLGVLFCGLSLLVGLALQVLSLGRDPRGLPLMLGGSLGLALALVMINPAPRTRYPLTPGQTVLSPAQLPRLDGLRLERLAIDVRDLPGDRSGKRVTVTARAAVLDDTPQHIRVMLSGDASDDRLAPAIGLGVARIEEAARAGRQAGGRGSSADRVRTHQRYADTGVGKGEGRLAILVANASTLGVARCHDGGTRERRRDDDDREDRRHREAAVSRCQC